MNIKRKMLVTLSLFIVIVLFVTACDSRVQKNNTKTDFILTPVNDNQPKEDIDTDVDIDLIISSDSSESQEMEENTESDSESSISQPTDDIAADVVKPINFGRVGILGDSYSTYENAIVEGNWSWYKKGRNGDLENKLSKVEQTWWKRLMTATGSDLVTNESFSGSAIGTGTKYGNMPGNSNFISRMKKSFNGEVHYDTIFVYGGICDLWLGMEKGVPQYSNWSDEDLKSTVPAFCYIINYLKEKNPNTRIVNISDPDVLDLILQGMADTCAYYKVDNIVLTKIEKQGEHPSAYGMKQIKEQILAYFE